MAEFVYPAVINTALGIIRTMRWRVEVIGGTHIPEVGPAVIASNHISYLDYILAGYAARERGRRIRFLAKKEAFDKRGLGWLMRHMHHIPVDRAGSPGDSLAAAIAQIERGELIGMYPEATISPSFVPRRGKTGTVRLAQETKAPLLPMAVWGGQRVMTKWRPKNLQRKVPMIVNIGPPMELSFDEDLESAARRLMTEITRLLADAQARYPDQPSGDDDRWWLPAHLGGTAPTPEAAEIRLEEERAARAARRAARDT